MEVYKRLHHLNVSLKVNGLRVGVGLRLFLSTKNFSYSLIFGGFSAKEPFTPSSTPLIAILKDNIVTKRFVFNKSSIDAPRFLFKGPSCVEVVSAFICSHFIAMA